MNKFLSPVASGWVVLFGAVFLWFHWPALGFYFSQDDFPLLATSRPGWVSPLQFFEMGSEREYRPLTQRFYFYFNQLFFGLEPRGHHGMNLLVHLANALLAGWLALRWVAPWTFIPAAFLFAFHPVHFFEVFWVSGISQAGYVFFLLASLAALVEFQLRGRPVWYVLSLFAAAGAFLSKEDAVALPAILTSTLLLANRRGTWREYIRVAAPYWILLAVYLGVRVGVLGFGLPEDELYRPRLDLWMLGAKLIQYLRALLLNGWWAGAVLVLFLYTLRRFPARTAFFAWIALLSVAPTLPVLSSSSHYLSFASAALAWGIVLLLDRIQPAIHRQRAAVLLGALFLGLAWQQREANLSNSSLHIPLPRKAQWSEEWMSQLRALPPPPEGCTIHLWVEAPLETWESAWIQFLPRLAWNLPDLPVAVHIAPGSLSSPTSGCIREIRLAGPDL